MGKKSKKKNKNKNKPTEPARVTHNTPFVSVCTPTYNRRLFIPQLIKCFKQQTYPKEYHPLLLIFLHLGDHLAREILHHHRLHSFQLF